MCIPLFLLYCSKCISLQIIIDNYILHETFSLTIGNCGNVGSSFHLFSFLCERALSVSHRTNEGSIQLAKEYDKLFFFE